MSNNATLLTVDVPGHATLRFTEGVTIQYATIPNTGLTCVRIFTSDKRLAFQADILSLNVYSIIIGWETVTV